MKCGEEMPELSADKANGLYRPARLPDDLCPDYEV